MSATPHSNTEQMLCYHCGAACSKQSINSGGDKYFCCQGCRSVYEILNENNLCAYYDLNTHPGKVQKDELREGKFAFLDNDDIKRQIVQFSDGKQSQITFYLPQIHCSSCLWLLEQLPFVNQGIIAARVNFSQKELFIAYQEQQVSLRQVVELLAQIGYEPYLNLNQLSSKDVQKTDRSRWYKIGVAGFCFGNIMMMSFADYFAFANSVEHSIQVFFKSISVILSLPVLLYSASEFFVSAWSSIRNKYLNIDVPVALALLITFVRSMYDIFSGSGNGYLDSMSGIVFFMLIGRWLQSRTFQTISFDRDYKSFFPIALDVVKNGTIIPTEISKIQVNDIVQVHSHEIIPVDALVSKGTASIDYSFVSGESEAVPVRIGELIYAGGKQTGGLLELVVVKTVSQSYLTHLWNNPVFTKKEQPKANLYDIISKYFSYAVLLLGAAAALYWYAQGATHLMWNALTTVLIVACPCALLLSQNYTQGNILRILGLNGFYLRSAEVIDELPRIQHIVLDKTGTLTQVQGARLRYYGKTLNEAQKQQVAALVQHSSHPASKMILEFLNMSRVEDVSNFKETAGKGIEGWIADTYLKVGSPEWVGGSLFPQQKGSKSVLWIEGEIVGEFVYSNQYRLGVSHLIGRLKNRYTLSLLSGDNDTELPTIEALLGKDSPILFHQNPQQKLEYIKDLQNRHRLQVMMVGDGLNDAGALKQSNIGIAVSDSDNHFTPASDGIIAAEVLNKLDVFIRFAASNRPIILFSFIVSAIYNMIGLYYAVQGILSPVVAAILMPASSITIVFLTYGLTELMAKRFDLK